MFIRHARGIFLQFHFSAQFDCPSPFILPAHHPGLVPVRWWCCCWHSFAGCLFQRASSSHSTYMIGRCCITPQPPLYRQVSASVWHASLVRNLGPDPSSIFRLCRRRRELDGRSPTVFSTLPPALSPALGWRTSIFSVTVAPMQKHSSISFLSADMYLGRLGVF